MALTLKQKQMMASLIINPFARKGFPATLFKGRMGFSYDILTEVSRDRAEREIEWIYKPENMPKDKRKNMEQGRADLHRTLCRFYIAQRDCNGDMTKAEQIVKKMKDKQISKLYNEFRSSTINSNGFVQLESNMFNPNLPRIQTPIHRFYLNPEWGYFEIITNEFINKCIEHNIPFCMKYDCVIREDALVFYTNDDFVAQTLFILQEIAIDESISPHLFAPVPSARTCYRMQRGICYTSVRSKPFI